MSEPVVDLSVVADVEPPNHPLLVRVTGWLSDIIVGEEAARLLQRLDSGTVAETGAELHVGQVWIWRESRIPVGRKARASGGMSYRLPIRSTWDGGHLTVARTGLAEQAARAWRARGMGWNLTGDFHPVCLNGSAPIDVDTPPSLLENHSPADDDLGPAASPVIRVVAGPVRPALQSLVEAGRHARWTFLMWLQPTVVSCLAKAHSGIRAEMGTEGQPARPLVDQVKLDQLADLMLFGDGIRTSSAERLIALCVKPGTFAKVDPLRYLTTAIRRDSATTLRRAIGDPHIGRKVRRLARELGTDDVETVVAAYRRRWPSDHLAADRATQALSVGSDPMASWVSVK